MNRLTRSTLGLLAIPALLASADALAACRVTQLSGEYLYSTTLRANNGEFFCHGAGAMTVTGTSTMSFVDLDKCSGEANRTVQTSTGTYTFDQARCIMSFRTTDPESGSEILSTVFFDSRGVKFRGVLGTNLMGVSGSIEGERR
ncbi:MAG: hypothetical protein EBS23_10200 [Betaproteobacteria bacterium]|nr:hypothetical protein [Betaproteobacteria bacterium]